MSSDGVLNRRRWKLEFSRQRCTSEVEFSRRKTDGLTRASLVKVLLERQTVPDSDAGNNCIIGEGSAKLEQFTSTVENGEISRSRPPPTLRISQPRSSISDVVSLAGETEAEADRAISLDPKKNTPK
ncbi:hydrogenasesmall subunit HydA [Striga asiatica]|uniref:Hydrogenasesmall subunit HydA n=1 Tax=Striga asiatica TaxID=4170 RepID=A0A5A7PG68_STRAF|nr:hydrogenasesmall subunit HydA [Striga asiatica]